MYAVGLGAWERREGIEVVERVGCGCREDGGS